MHATSQPRGWGNVHALVAHGTIDGGPLAELSDSIGYCNVAFDLLLLRNILADAWPRIASSSPVTIADLEQDAAIASRLLMAAGAKSVAPVEPSETARVRDQAFTLFANKYDELRCAVSYVRWRDGDADQYAPSLYAGRGHRKPKAAATTDAPAPAASATVPVAVASPTTTIPAASPAPVDLPGASPFVT